MTTATHANDIGTRIADSIRQHLGAQKYAMWFDGSARFDYREQDHRLTVTVPTQFARNWIARHFSPDLSAAAKATTGDSVTLDLRVQPDEPSRPAAQSAGAWSGGARPPATRTAAGAGEPDPAPAAGPAHTPVRARQEPGFKHRLDQFVTGPSNQLAYAAAMRAADLNDPTANHPLFLHGKCGVGKTHLLQGICAQARLNKPGAKVVYLTAEQFTNEFITAVRNNKLEAFRRRIRRLDLLAIDDVHFLASKEKTQTEFVCCFEENDLAGARVILASDNHPRRIPAFSEGLVSRCVRGLVVAVNEPDPVTRRAVLAELARRRGLFFQPAVLELLGRRYDGSVRELEGALAQLHALATLPTRSPHRGPAQPIHIGRELVEQLPDFGAPVVRRPVRFEVIARAVCERMMVDPKKLNDSSRHKHLVLARSLTVRLARELTTMSYPEIAHAMGRKNHSTVITADQRMQRLLKEDEPLMLPASHGPTTPSELIDSLKREVLRAG